MKSLQKSILFSLILFVCAQAFSEGEILNPGFEIVDPNTQGSVTIYLPIDWSLQNNALAIMEFENPNPNRLHWSFAGEETLMPVEGSYMAHVNSEDTPSNVTSELQQIIEVLPGDRICGAYYFATEDWIPYLDYARLYLEPVESGPTIYIIEVGVEDVGSYSSTDGWQRFCYTVPQNVSGFYTLGMQVANREDNQYTSHFLIDDLSLCPNGKESDLNYDCVTNNLDYQILSEYWHCDCTDPNMLPDPNICPWRYDGQGQIQVLFDGDIDEDKAVTFTDLMELIKNWVNNL